MLLFKKEGIWIQVTDIAFTCRRCLLKARRTEIIGSCGEDTGWLGFLLNFELYGSIPFKP